MAIIFSQPHNGHLRRADPKLTRTIPVEKWRCIAYFFFWTMVGLANVMSKIFVAPMLLNGPVDGTIEQKMGCGPFDRVDKGFGVDVGEGFIYPDQSHLAEAFGFSNICTAWDYTPSREVTAMYFPLFEFALVFYLFLDILNTNISYNRGELPEWFWTFSKTVFGLNVVLCIWFRMIFVVIAYEDAGRHTLGFLGLQIALMLVAFQNFFYVIMTGQSYPTWNLSTRQTAIIAKTYLILLVCISAVKISATVYIVIHGEGPAFYKEDSFIPGMVKGQVVDLVWMLFNALIPVLIAIVRAKNEDPLEFEVTCRTPTYENVGDEQARKGENAPLNPNNA